MIASKTRARAGITLTEILISILIMGIGLISLATLFPLGLIRLRDANRFQRGGILAQSASDDLDARALLYKPSFTQTWYGSQDPFTSDAAYGGFTNPVQTLGPNSSGLPQPGLPICYDPLWRAVTNVVPANGALADPTLVYKPFAGSIAAEARFGAAIVVTGQGTVNAFGVRKSAPLDSKAPSAYGLQRITNFIPWSSVAGSYNHLFPFTYFNKGLTGTQAPDVAGDVFTSVDDIVFNSSEGATKNSSPLVPDLTLSGNSTPTNDWRYTWFFTGRQVDSTNGAMFQGDVVICDARQFGFIPLPAPNATTYVPVGETVVEAVFGYSTNVGPTGFAVGSDRTVLLRWPTSLGDPTVRIGSWIADVTYERDATTSLGTAVNPGRTPVTQTPFQRCFWYQVTKRTEPQPDPDFTPDAGGINYRRMILTIASPVRAKTYLGTGGVPQFVNVALVMPSVINVFPRAFTVH